MTKNRHRMPEVKFINDSASQVNYLCFLAKQLTSRDYLRRDFFVLPYLKTGATNTVHFPDLPYPPKFWRQIKRIKGCDVGQKYPGKIVSSVVNFLPPPTNTTPVGNVWRKTAAKFWRAIIKTGTFDSQLKRNLKFTVLTTDFGPGSSFASKKNHVFLTFRRDRHPKDLARSIISALVLLKFGRPGNSLEKFWRNRFYSEFISRETALSRILPRLNLPPVTGRDQADSRKFLAKLGVGKIPTMRLLDNAIVLGKTNLSRRLSPQENLILKELVVNKSLTHDQMAEILWGQRAEEKFSLWAQTKLIQKLRAKLKNAGVNPLAITTVYARGYQLES